MRQEFNGKLEMEWISIDDRLPLHDHDAENFGVLSYVYALLVDEEDLNDDPTVVDICYHKAVNRSTGKVEEGWQYSPGEEYPKIHVDRIRYWCYHPYYRLQDILDWERRNR